jgi:hypothetical protein
VRSRRLLKTGLLLLGVAVWMSCASASRSTPDPWYQPSPGVFDSSWSVLPALAASRVAKTHRDAAIRLLADSPWVALDSAQAESLSELTEPRLGTPYLLRGLCISCGAQGFSVHVRGTQVAVHSFGLAGRRSPTHHWPVVAWLSEPPGKLFVSCSAAE